MIPMPATTWPWQWCWIKNAPTCWWPHIIKSRSSLRVCQLCAIGSDGGLTLAWDAVSEMEKRNIDQKTGGVCFAQLLGMCDHLTYTLGMNGYKVNAS